MWPYIGARGGRWWQSEQPHIAPVFHFHTIAWCCQYIIQYSILWCHQYIIQPENTEHQQMAFGETDERSLTWTFSTSRQFGSIWLMAKTDIFKCSADDDFGAYSSYDSLDCLSWCIDDDTGGITIELISKSKDYHWKRNPTFTKMHFICNPFSVIPGRKLTRKGKN